jgi:DNA-binding NarL/FixJ family response regulator
VAQAKLNQVKDSRKRVLLVDDHAVVRYGIAQLINQQSDLVVCGE